MTSSITLKAVQHGGTAVTLVMLTVVKNIKSLNDQFADEIPLLTSCSFSLLETDVSVVVE